MTAIDIILPYYNGSKYIKEQLESIEKNDTEGINLRLIVINDASKSDEAEYLKSILPANALYLENEKNLGVIKTVERGLEISTAPYIMLCDQDDVWLPNKIKHSLNRLKDIEGNDPTLVYTDLVIVDKDLNTIHPSMHAYYKHDHGSVYPAILFHNIVTGCTVIFNRKLLEFALPFPEKVTMHDHWIAICAVFAGKAELLDEATILYRQHGSNQVGVPEDNSLNKLINFRKTVPKFRIHTELKTLMIKDLVMKLELSGFVEQALFLREAIKAIETKNFFFLLNKGLIRGNLLRTFGVITLLTLTTKKI